MVLSSLIKSFTTHLLIGENGAGKSQLLSKISEEISFTYPKARIVVIANTIHNKFPKLRVRNYFRLSSNKLNFANEAILHSLSMHSKRKNELKILSLLSQSLEYIGFESRIKISFKIRKDEDIKKNIYSMEYIKSINSKDVERIYHFIDGLISHEESRSNSSLISVSYVINLIDVRYNFEVESLLLILEHKHHLRKNISDIKVSLFKNEEIVKLLEASSGELSLLATLAYISSNIDNDSYILIDEPENSLHPRWQREYISHIHDLFYYYSPTIICATHSPVIVSGACDSEMKTAVYEVKERVIKHMQHKDSRNIEEILADVFKLITPENRYLSHFFNSLIHDFSQGNISEESLLEKLKVYRSYSYDADQIKMLDSIPLILERLKKNG